ncbi:hypothetical protein FI667_g5925, partial [Globisporangium splendens]
MVRKAQPHTAAQSGSKRYVEFHESITLDNPVSLVELLPRTLQIALLQEKQRQQEQHKNESVEKAVETPSTVESSNEEVNGTSPHAESSVQRTIEVAYPPPEDLGLEDDGQAVDLFQLAMQHL